MVAVTLSKSRRRKPPSKIRDSAVEEDSEEAVSRERYRWRTRTRQRQRARGSKQRGKVFRGARRPSVLRRRGKLPTWMTVGVPMLSPRPPRRVPRLPPIPETGTKPARGKRRVWPIA
ncbi:hypothetical protein Esi_0112_0062 [Ectocarpus siliculosus]|uniref:Uncharacterized protein n=1 Tax=Ectocarpus siliculosus TaxID=2880 RepID=D8LD07_ECTSI|nr:hypothetical protein Esi_0112_0062 [Ectocarpus siliculosus]|eukprot:CBN78374.1 hypothetical protein Esi_0112_0062 [Ectocarpus siliculosus]